MHKTPATPAPAYLPAMGHHRLLGLYDPFVTLLGVESLHRALLERAAVRPGQRVLEIGCGTGNLVLLVKRRYPDVEVVGLDPDPRALARAQRKTRRAALSIRLDRGYAEALPYADGSFERVLSALMFHHLTAAGQVAALQEIRRVLAPGGTLNVLDFGGTYQPSGGLLSRLHHHADRLPELIRAAGLVNLTETVHGKMPLAGPVMIYGATAPASQREDPDAVH